ncbi:MAG: M28 family peptidase [Gemmatimonadota bacterium]|nr:M28 family peptidase [Gemmatimonadota bacterium]
MVALIIAFLVALSISPVAASTGPRAVVEHLSSLESRVAGYPGSVRAAEYVEGRLQALGLATRRDSFAVVVPMDRGGRLEWEDESVPLYAVWPNGVRTSTVPPEGLRAPAIWGGDGDWGDFNGQEVAGRVVVLDFASGDNWLKAASLGARAVVFVAADLATTQQAQGKYLRAPLDVPRFWVEGAAGERLRRRLVDGEVEVGLWGRMDWQERMAYNVWAVMPGKDAGTAQNETVLVHAYYDAPSVVPARAPGAEAAVSVAAMLEVAARLQANPPAHTVILAALGAHFQGRQGIVAFLDRHARRQEYYAARLAEPLNIDLFIGLDLSSHGERVVLWNNTDSYALKRFFVPFGRRFAEYAEALGRAEAVANGISPIRGMDWDSYMPGGLAADGELALEAGFPSLTLATVGDARFALDLPQDTGERVAWDNVEGQAALVADLLAHALADTALLAGRERLDEALKDRLRDLRVKARTFPRRSQVPDRPVAGALVAVQVEQEERKGVRDVRYFLTDAAGLARIPGLVQGTYPLTVAALDAERGTITHVVDLSERAQAHHGKPRPDGRLAKNVRWRQNEQSAVLFPGVGRPLYGLVEPRLLRALNKVKVLSADGGEPSQYGYVLGKSSIGSVGVIYGPTDAAADDRVKVILDDQLLLLNSEGSQSETEARGRGFLLTEEGFGAATLQAARDVWNLDAARLGVLKEHGIENQRLTRLHAQAAVAIAEAEAAAEQLKWDEYVAWSRKALGLETRAYPEVLATLNDVLEGVIFFMALLLPAAFFGERLLFAAADIRRQLAGFGLLLLAIWLILAQVHPAFELAEPLVVLLAFAIMAMAAFVLFMLVSRFNSVMAQHQSQQMRVHAQDLSRLSASYAAFMLGISNMRRRPLRTGLTLATLTLLTFTLLSFTSFEQQIRYASFRLSHTGAYPGILIRDRGWERLTPEALDYAESHFGGSGWMGRRGWYATEGGKGSWISVAAAGNAVRATGLLGLTPEEAQITEVDKSLVAGSFFVADDEATCILPLDMAEALGVGVGDQVEVFGRTLEVRGIADPERLGELRDLDDESLMPADFVLSGAEMLQLGAARAVDIAGEEDPHELRPFIHIEPQHVVIVPYQTLIEAGGSLRSVVVRFPGETDGQALVEDYLTRVAVTLFVGSPDGRVTALSSVGLTAVQGLGVLAIPALVAALIVLNAMMGAVYERLREIGIYSSVGLAPLHIALLFVAEACVYAVLGTTLGYLLGQGLGRVLLGLLGFPFERTQ